MTAVAKLLPCPFCGSDVESYQQTSKVPDNWAVRCDVCGAQCGPSASSTAARYNWNTRALSARASAGEGGGAIGGGEALVKSWRERANRMLPTSGVDTHWHQGARDGMNQCAAELERALLTTPASPATGAAATWEEEIRRHDATPQPAAAQGWPSSEPGYTTLFNAIAAATSNYAGIGVNVSVSKFLEALAAAPQPQADECPACKLGQATCGYHARNPATPPAQECKHKWRNSDRADPMLPCAWVQQCAKCGAYEDEN